MQSLRREVAFEEEEGQRGAECAGVLGDEEMAVMLVKVKLLAVLLHQRRLREDLGQRT